MKWTPRNPLPWYLGIPVVLLAAAAWAVPLPQEPPGNRKATVARLTQQLTDPSFDERVRAGGELYRLYQPEDHNNQELGEALRASLRLGNSAAGAVVLLGYFPGEASGAVLADVVQRGKPLKLVEWMPPVSAELVAAVARTRWREPAAKDVLLNAVQERELHQQVFLLTILRDIDDRETLLALAGVLDDRRSIRQGVPSGGDSPRRLCDLAVEAFVHRFELKPSFELTTSRAYSDQALQEIRQAVPPAVAALDGG